MKRVALSVFLALFAASVIGRSVERTVSWASQHAHDFGRSTPDRTGVRMAEARKHNPGQLSKSVQDGSLALSFTRSFDPLLPETTLHHALTAVVLDPNNRILSSRAPPAII